MGSRCTGEDAFATARVLVYGKGSEAMGLLGSLFHSFRGSMQSTCSPCFTACWLLLMDDPCLSSGQQPCQPENGCFGPVLTGSLSDPTAALWSKQLGHWGKGGGGEDWSAVNWSLFGQPREERPQSWSFWVANRLFCKWPQRPPPLQSP